MTDTQKPSKLCFIDVETTGLLVAHNNIHQIASLIVDPETQEIIDKFQIAFKPQPGLVEPSALDKCKLTLAELEARETESHLAFSQFIDFLSKHCNKYDPKDKMHFVAYNAPFDSEFVRQWYSDPWGYNGKEEYFGSYFWNPPLCVMQGFAWFTRTMRPSIPNFQLGTICKVAEIVWDDEAAHDAMYDIKKTHELWKACNL